LTDPEETPKPLLPHFGETQNGEVTGRERPPVDGFSCRKFKTSPIVETELLERQPEE
jgi:hypothetical protein